MMRLLKLMRDGILIMFTSKQPNNERRASYRPLVYLSAFFHPTSREELRADIDQAKKTVEESRRISDECDRLSRQVEKELARDAYIVDSYFA